MAEARLRFPEYSSGRHGLESRRVRRAVRVLVAIAILTPFLLWFAERYLHYDGPERLFLMSLDKHPASARPLLRQAVKQDEGDNETATPKYVFALAVREEEDLTLEVFEKAYRLDPRNPALAMRYGCELLRPRPGEAPPWLDGDEAAEAAVSREEGTDVAIGPPPIEERARHARDLFRAAQAASRNNALPIYLEAAALPWTGRGDQALREALLLMVRGNNSSAPVRFPPPIWHPSLPEEGLQYAKLQRRIIGECAAPLLRLANAVVHAALTEEDRSAWQEWSQRLEDVGAMGARLGSGGANALAARASVEIRLQSARARLALHQRLDIPPAPELPATVEALEAASADLAAFEERREQVEEAQRRRHRFALGLIWRTLAWLCGLYAAVRIAGWVAGGRGEGMDLPQARYGWAAMLAGGLALSAVFAASFALQHGAGGTGWMAPMSVLWRVALVVSLGWGLAYPAVRLPRPRAAAERRAAAENLAEPPVKQARTAYLRAYLGLLQRYAGSLTGLVVCGASLCVVLHRVLWDIYPWQFELLVSGLAAEERELVARVLAVLGAS